MCGIVGYVGKRELVPIILDGSRRLNIRATIPPVSRFAATARVCRSVVPRASCAILKKSSA